MIDRLTIAHEYGAPRHFTALYCLQKQGFVKEIRTMEFNIPLQIGKAAVYRSRGVLSRCLYNVKELTKLLFVDDATIIIGAAPYDPAMLFLHKLRKRNRIVYFPSWPFWGERHAKKPLLPTVKGAWHNFLSGTLTVAVTEAASRGVTKYGAMAVHIPHSVDTQVFTKTPGSPKTDSINILFVGSLAEGKGIPMLLDVIGAGHWPRDVQFWFVGDGPYKQQIIAMRENHPVKYLGYISEGKDLASIYQQADIFILPSTSEIFGIVLIEAMASGLPIVSTDCVGPKEIIDNNENGFLIPRGDKEELRERLMQLIENPALREEMGARGRKKAEEVYDVKVIAAKWQAILESLSANE